MNVNDYDIVADLYDDYVPAAFDIPFFISETKKGNGEVLELMSGSGRVSIPLLQAGVKLTCLDISAELNAIFEQKLEKAGLRAEVHLMDVRELDLSRQFERIIIPFHSFAHLVSVEDQRQALQRIYRHLSPGGIFICTLGNPAIRKQKVDGQMRLFRKYPLANGQETLLLWISENTDPVDQKIVHAMQFFEIYDSRGLLQSRRLLELHFRLVEKDEFEELASEAGFRINTFYGDYDYSPFHSASSPYMIWLLEKNETE